MPSVSNPSRKLFTVDTGLASSLLQVWSALMCYDEILRTPQLRAKAELLLQRVSSICEKIDDHWLSNVRAVQPLRKNLWERVERNGGGYLHYVTGEYVTDVPNIFSLDAT
eukprot:scaffold166475_cov30-Tisochrysis_lutea.AAC.1